MNGPARIDLARSVVFIDAGDSVSIQAEVKDEAGNVFSSADATWASGDETVAVARKDTVYIPGGAFSRVFIRGVSGGQTYARITSNGLTDSLRVVVVPTVFNGTVLPATSNLGDTVTITATSALSFSTAAGSLTDVTVGGLPVYIISRTAGAIKFIGPKAATSDSVILTNVLLLGSIRVATLPATARITVNEPSDPADDAPAGAATMTLYKDYYGTVNGSDIDDYVKFTTPATADSVMFQVDWVSDADIDVGVLNSAGGCISATLPGSCYATMGSSANPEIGRWRLAANTTYQIDINVYDAGHARRSLYRIRTTKLN